MTNTVAKMYAVTSMFYDNGTTEASIEEYARTDRLPEPVSESYEDCDCYVDWFETREEAEAHARDVYNA